MALTLTILGARGDDGIEGVGQVNAFFEKYVDILRKAVAYA